MIRIGQYLNARVRTLSKKLYAKAKCSRKNQEIYYLNKKMLAKNGEA